MLGRARSLTLRSVLVLLSVLGWSLSPASAMPTASAEIPICRQALPTATDGTFVLDRATARPGETVLGVLSGFRRWPERLIGGGSGETFLNCVPWRMFDQAEVMAHDSAAFFTVRVPSGIRAGSYPVSVLFFEGPSQPLTGGRLVRLVSTLRVTSSPVVGSSPACRLHHAPAATGSLTAPASVPAGTVMRVALRGVTERAIGGLNEYDRLRYVACFGGQATAITDLTDATGKFSVPVPAHLPAGAYRLTVIGGVESGVVSWQRSVQVSAVQTRPMLRLSPDPARAGGRISVSGSCPSGHPGPVSVALISRAFDRAGGHDWDGLNGVWRFDPPGPAGRFSGSVLLRAGASGSYSVGMRCDGGLAGSWSLTVTPVLATTGSAVTSAAIAAVLAIAAGSLLLLMARRRG